nr:MAG TPA: hypothetical protein [Caudoviricetes sp.]
MLIIYSIEFIFKKSTTSLSFDKRFDYFLTTLINKFE